MMAVSMSSAQGSPSRPTESSLPTPTPERDVSDTHDSRSSATASRYKGREDILQRSNGDAKLHRMTDEHKPTGALENERHLEGETSDYRRNRNSGGFLLDTIYNKPRPGTRLLQRNNAGNIKSKSRSQDPCASGLAVPKRSDRYSRISSAGSSPLATKVSTLDDGDITIHTNTSNDTRLDASENLGLVPDARGRLPSMTEPEASSPKASAVEAGHVTDPMQIVNMALSLSDGRRRHGSGVRLASSTSSIGSSTLLGQSANRRDSQPQSSLRGYIGSSRQLSRNVSPGGRGLGQMNPTDTSANSMLGSGGYLNSGITDDADPDANDDSYDASNATFLRVQKAKTHFELVYEHRRLLSHIPPLRRVSGASRQLETEGRIYNPLQVARNRKIRFREKQPMEMEAEGWQDVQRVRTWVNAVIEGHLKPRVDPDECVRLPEPHIFPPEIHVGNFDSFEASPSSSTSRNREANPRMKTRQPRLDWFVSPGDLLADIYWLEQGLNKTRIEDRDGNRIYPSGTGLKYNDWRNTTPADDTRHLPVPSSQPTDTHEPNVANNLDQPELPIFHSAGRRDKHSMKAPRRQRRRQPDSDSGKSDSHRKRQKRRFRKTFIPKRSRSSSSASGNQHSSKQRTMSSGTNSDDVPVGINGTANLTQSEPEPVNTLVPSSDRRSENLQSAPGADSRQDSRDLESRVYDFPKRRRDSISRLEVLRGSLDKPPLGLSTPDDDRPISAALDYDSTAPSSPRYQLPGTAINLSTPSRSPSPGKKLIRSRINSFRERHQSKPGNKVDSVDSANPSALSSSQQRPGELENDPHLIHGISGEPSPRSRPTRRTSEAESSPDNPQNGSTSAFKPPAKIPIPLEVPTRLRGLFKGGKLSGLVGNEFSRVGDFIWRREGPTATGKSSSASSLKSPHDSESEDDSNASGRRLKRAFEPRPGPSSLSPERVNKVASPSQGRSTARNGDKPTHYMSNLPLFTSPFQRDREANRGRGREARPTLDSSPPSAQGLSDHISRAAAQQRSVAKNPELNRLSPLEIDTSQLSPPVKSGNRRRTSHDLTEKARLAGPLLTSRHLNDALGRRKEGLPVTGLTGLQPSKSGVGLNSDWDSTRREVTPESIPGVATAEDIARTHALLLSSGVKAWQISQRAHLIRTQTPRFLIESVQADSSEAMRALRVPRKDEQILAARNLLCRLGTQSNNLRSSMDHFTSTTSPSLHTAVQALDDLVEKALTPRVQAASNKAGDLSMSLTTTSTLAVNDLNDLIDGAMRRRRKGPVRWLKKLGYAVVEWMVVGLLWAIWLLVSVSQIIVGTVRGSTRALRWLFWLN